MKEFNEEMLDKELEALVGSMPEQDQLEKNIERKIKKKIQRTAARTVAAIVGIVIVLLLIINPFLNAICLNPVKLNTEGNQQMLTVLKSYYETTEPYIEPIVLNAKKKGFGRYELELQMTDRHSPVYYGVINVWVDMSLGKYKNLKNPDFSLAHMANRFEQDWNKREEIVEKMKELPESAIIYLSIAEKSPRNLEELRNENVELNWVELYQPNVRFQGGLYMEPKLIVGEEKLREDMTEEELKEAYISNLENMMEYPEIWMQFGLNSSRFSYVGGEMEMLKESIDDMKKIETLETKYYCISGKKDEIIAYLEKTDTESIRVDEVKMSEWSR